jgi:hypothetical protein
MRADIPGLDYQKCSHCNQWVIEPRELARIEAERDKAKPGKANHTFYCDLLEEVLGVKAKHESECLL